MSIDTMGNFFTSIRNALMVSKRVITVPHSNMKMGVAEVLKSEGFIKDFKKEEKDGKAVLTLYLKYVDGEAVIHEITGITKPGRRYYENLRNMRNVAGGLGISILSTNAGIITEKSAKKKMVGGEVLCHVW
jgi:small subunit ribosomal protein S8